MRRKIVLFIVGMVLAVGVFWGYQTYFGVDGSWNRPHQKTPDEDAGSAEKGGRNLDIESRYPTGDLEYLLHVDEAQPQGSGRYALTRPQLRYFLKDGRELRLTSDTANILVDQVGAGFSGKMFPKSGVMTGHVMMTLGPRDSYRAGTTDRQPEQFQVHLDDTLDFDYQQRNLNSDGGVHVRSDKADFDGAGLTLVFNGDNRQVEYLRVDHGDKIIIHHVSSSTGVAGSAGPLSTPPPPATPPPATAETAVLPADTGPGSPEIAIAATNKSAEPMAYRLTFGDNVKAVSGTRTLSSDAMAVVFAASGGAPLLQKTATAPAQTEIVPVSPAAVPNVPGPATAAATPLPTPATPLPAVQPDDLVITWTGKLEMRPGTAAALGLINDKDNILQAQAMDHPVVVQDGATRNATSTALLYHAADQSTLLSGSPEKPVTLADAALGQGYCQSLQYQGGDGRMLLAGPGKLVTKPAANGDKDGIGGKTMTAAWQQALNLTLIKVPDAANPQKTVDAVRQATFTGGADLSDPTFHLMAQSVDLLFAHTGDAKSRDALEHMLATGNVEVTSVQNPKNSDLPPDALQCERLELKTKTVNGQCAPDVLLADQNVTAVSYDSPKEGNAKPGDAGTQKIVTPHLVATLVPRSDNGGSRPPVENAGGQFSVSNLAGSGGVHVELTAAGTQPINADAESMDANVGTGHVILSSGKTATDDPAKWAALVQAGNRLAGPSIELDREGRSAHVSGAGEFIFLQPATKPEDAPRPILVTWDKQMNYDGKALRAEFAGHVAAVLQGQPLQPSKLLSDTLEIQLASVQAATQPSSTAAAGAADPLGLSGGKTRLSELTALGNVTADGATLDDQGNTLTHLLMHGAKVVYGQDKQTLRVVGPGRMLIEDFRPEQPAANATGGPAENSGKPAASSRGQTAFEWKDHLTYAGTTGDLQMVKDVRMVHKPAQPIHIGESKPAASRPADATLIYLNCQELDAKMQSAGGNVSSPLALGTGGASRITRVTADTQATLQMDQDQVSGDILDFDALKNVVRVRGRNGDSVTALRANSGAVTAQEITWDLTQGESGFSFTLPRVIGNSP